MLDVVILPFICTWKVYFWSDYDVVMHFSLIFFLGQKLPVCRQISSISYGPGDKTQPKGTNKNKIPRSYRKTKKIFLETAQLIVINN